MSPIIELLRSPVPPRFAAVMLFSIGTAACSGDSTRFSDNPFSSKPETTGSVQAAATPRVESRPLAAPTPTISSQGTVGGGRGMGSYTPSVARTTGSASDVTAAIAPPRAAPIGHWTWDGGTPIIVAPGETVDTIARRHGVPASAIIQANNLSGPAAIRAGQQLVIPRYQNPNRIAAVAPKPTAAAASPQPNSGVHVVGSGETLSHISRVYGKSVAEIAKANNIQANARLNVGDRLIIPGVRASAIQGSAVVADASAIPASSAKEPVTTGNSSPAGGTKEQRVVASASMYAPVVQSHADGETPSLAEGTGSLPKFRWPANGRVISSFGPATNGQQNDGINIAVPENTPVKAAEDGVVAYAGNELKGYGNLVLVRHPNGYVTAYAHAKELLVKRGDQVKRGQVIARSGQSGNVSAPQLHFEIRKGASPLDPSKFLNGA